MCTCIYSLPHTNCIKWNPCFIMATSAQCLQTCLHLRDRFPDITVLTSLAFLRFWKTSRRHNTTSRAIPHVRFLVSVVVRDGGIRGIWIFDFSTRWDINMFWPTWIHSGLTALCFDWGIDEKGPTAGHGFCSVKYSQTAPVEIHRSGIADRCLKVKVSGVLFDVKISWDFELWQQRMPPSHHESRAAEFGSRRFLYQHLPAQQLKIQRVSKQPLFKAFLC